MNIIKKILRMIKFEFLAKPCEEVKKDLQETNILPRETGNLGKTNPKAFSYAKCLDDVCTIKNSRICCKVCSERLECKYKCESFDEVCTKNVYF